MSKLRQHWITISNWDCKKSSCLPNHIAYVFRLTLTHFFAVYIDRVVDDCLERTVNVFTLHRAGYWIHFLDFTRKTCLTCFTVLVRLPNFWPFMQYSGVGLSWPLFLIHIRAIWSRSNRCEFGWRLFGSQHATTVCSVNLIFTVGQTGDMRSSCSMNTAALIAWHLFRRKKARSCTNSFIIRSRIQYLFLPMA